MINKTENQLILEDNCNQGGNVCHTPDVPRTDTYKSHWVASSLWLMLLLHVLHGKTILVFLEVDTNDLEVDLWTKDTDKKPTIWCFSVSFFCWCLFGGLSFAVEHLLWKYDLNYKVRSQINSTLSDEWFTNNDK